jgi:hypothetical protein
MSESSADPLENPSNPENSAARITRREENLRVLRSALQPQPGMKGVPLLVVYTRVVYDEANEPTWLPGVYIAKLRSLNEEYPGMPFAVTEDLKIAHLDESRLDESGVPAIAQVIEHPGPNMAWLEEMDQLKTEQSFDAGAN